MTCRAWRGSAFEHEEARLERGGVETQPKYHEPAPARLALPVRADLDVHGLAQGLSHARASGRARRCGSGSPSQTQTYPPSVLTHTVQEMVAHSLMSTQDLFVESGSYPLSQPPHEEVPSEL